jgi:hypothetical protein
MGQPPGAVSTPGLRLPCPRPVPLAACCQCPPPFPKAILRQLPRCALGQNQKKFPSLSPQKPLLPKIALRARSAARATPPVIRRTCYARSNRRLRPADRLSPPTSLPARSLSLLRCSMFNVGCSMFDVRCWMFDVQCSMFDVRCSTPTPLLQHPLRRQGELPGSFQGASGVLRGRLGGGLGVVWGRFGGGFFTPSSPV